MQQLTAGHVLTVHTAACCTPDCLGFPHIIHAAFSITSGLVFFIVAFLLVSCWSWVAPHPTEQTASTRGPQAVVYGSDQSDGVLNLLCACICTPCKHSWQSTNLDLLGLFSCRCWVIMNWSP